MWIRHLVLLAALITFSAAVAWAEDFEGALKIQVYKKGRDLEVMVYLKDQRARMEAYVSGQKWRTVLYDTTTKTATSIDHVKQKVVQHSFDEITAAASKQTRHPRGPLSKTGNQGRVANLAAEQYLHSHADQSVTEWWVTPDLHLSPSLVQKLHELCTGRPATSDLASLLNRGMMSVKTVRTAADGTVLFRSEVTEVIRGPVSEDLFHVPTQYHD